MKRNDQSRAAVRAKQTSRNDPERAQIAVANLALFVAGLLVTLSAA